ncbi:putative ATP-dependent RNA helicase DDX28 [Styela clava]
MSVAMLRNLCIGQKLTVTSVACSVRFASSVKVNGQEIPIIRYPLGQQKKFIQAKDKKKRRGKLICVPKPGKLLISTDDRKLNMYTNEFPTKFEPPTLASQTWTSRNSPGRFFVIHATRNNPATDYDDKDKASFNDYGLNTTVNESLQKLGVEAPTQIQNKVLPIVMNGENVMLAAETGSGKTYGYLIPIINKILEIDNEDFVSSGPTALILTPSKELSAQVVKMTRDFNLAINVTDLDNFHLMRTKKHVNHADIVVGTPIIMLTMLRNRKLSLDNINFAVVDECDTLLDKSFSTFTCAILGRLNIKHGLSKPLVSSSDVQLILCSATFPDYAEQALEDIVSLSNISAISTGYMHRISPHVTHKFLRVRSSEKLATLLNILNESKVNEYLTMIFCNKKESVHWLTKELIFHGLHAEMIHSGLDIKKRKSIIQQVRAGKAKILVCTDLSSRGIDTQSIHHVINFEFPNAASDYVHRSGRVGRVGQNTGAKVTSLISKRWEIPLLMQIEEAARRRERIQNVNANIKSHHKDRWNEKKEEELE